MLSAFLCVLAGVAWWVGFSFTARELGLEPVSRDPEITGRLFGVVVSMFSLFGYEVNGFARAVKVSKPMELAIAYLLGVLGAFFATLLYPLHPEGLRDILLGSLSQKTLFLMGFSEGAVVYVLFLFALNLFLNLLRLIR